MSNVTKLTYAKYVSIIECGGKAFAFYVDEDGDEERNADHALVVLTSGTYDQFPDKQNLTGQRYYTLTE